jgi:hypothetical protein
VYSLTRRAADLGRTSILEVFAAGRTDLNVPDNSRCTPLGWTIKQGHDVAALALVRAGANGGLLFPNIEASAALVVAARNGRAALVPALTQAG